MLCPKIWNTEKNREREKRESWRQASETQREKERQIARARDKRQRRHFFVKRTTWKFCSGGGKLRNASGHKGENERRGSEKTNEQEHVRHFFPETCNQEVSRILI